MLLLLLLLCCKSTIDVDIYAGVQAAESTGSIPSADVSLDDTSQLLQFDHITRLLQQRHDAIAVRSFHLLQGRLRHINDGANAP